MSKTLSFRNLFIFFGLGLQLISWIILEDTLLSFLSGCLGVVSVVLCSDRRISFYLFGFLQLGTYLILSFQNKLWGEVGENIFYFLTMLLGLFIWKKNTEKGEVKAKRFGKGLWAILGSGTLTGIIILWLYLKNTSDPQPLLDSITTVPAFIAQILMIFRYREQWIFWLIIDLGSIILWYNSGNWCMVSQYIFWTGNCIYGWIRWKG